MKRNQQQTRAEHRKTKDLQIQNIKKLEKKINNIHFQQETRGLCKMYIVIMHNKDIASQILKVSSEVAHPSGRQPNTKAVSQVNSEIN